MTINSMYDELIVTLTKKLAETREEFDKAENLVFELSKAYELDEDNEELEEQRSEAIDNEEFLRDAITILERQIRKLEHMAVEIIEIF